MKTPQFIVRVSCMTYNQASYILDALNGFAMQQTDFPFVCIVMDDASTDGEPEIIKKYLQDNFSLDDEEFVKQEETDDYFFVFSRHKTNLNCYFAVYFLKYNHYSVKKSKKPYIHGWLGSKYVAICEGDDYWIHEYKLQKQVQVMEKEPEIGLVFTNYILLNQVSGVQIEKRIPCDITFDSDFKWKIIDQRLMISTNTILIRSELYQKIRNIKEDFEGFIMSDTQLWFHSARLSKVSWLEDVTSVYRKQPTGLTAIFHEDERTISFLKNCLDLDLHLANKYSAPKDPIIRIKSKFGFSLIRIYIILGLFKEAQETNKDYMGNSKTIALIIKTYSSLRFLSPKGVGTMLDKLWKIGMIKIK